MKKLIDDYKLHGYKLTKEGKGLLVFESDYDYNLKHIDKDIAKKHPIFDEDSKSMKSKVIIHSICGRCNEPIVDGKCTKCNRIIKNMTEKKGHIPTLKEIKKDKQIRR